MQQDFYPYYIDQVPIPYIERDRYFTYLASLDMAASKSMLFNTMWILSLIICDLWNNYYSFKYVIFLPLQ